MSAQSDESSYADRLISMLVSDPDAFWQAVGVLELVDEIYRGFAIDKIRELALHDDDRIARAAVCVLSELGHRAAAALPEALVAIRRRDYSIRYHALDVVLLATEHDSRHEFANVIALLDDPHAGVRSKALRFVASASDEQIDAAITQLTQDAAWVTRVPQLRRMLTRTLCDEAAMEATLGKRTPFDQQLAVAAAERMFETHPHWLRRASRELDEEYRSMATHFLELHGLRNAARSADDERSGGQEEGQKKAVTDFGTCCSELRDAMTSPPNSTFHVETDVLYLSVGFIETENGPGWFDSAVMFCPFCGTKLQTRQDILLKTRS